MEQNHSSSNKAVPRAQGSHCKFGSFQTQVTPKLKHYSNSYCHPVMDLIIGDEIFRSKLDNIVLGTQEIYLETVADSGGA